MPAAALTAGSRIGEVVVHAGADPEVVIAEQQLTAVDLSTQAPLVVPSLLILRAREGRIVHTRDYSAPTPMSLGDVGRLSLELVTVPVADIDRAKAFYVDQVGFRAVQDHEIDERHRFVQPTHPARRARSRLPPDTSTPSRAPCRTSSWSSTTSTRSGPGFESGRSTCPPSTSSRGALLFFSDPDGNGWSVQQPPSRG
jgi:catechol 2,3-dioxygenase-like lactoylglutathione lyase family enzyme